MGGGDAPGAAAKKGRSRRHGWRPGGVEHAAEAMVFGVLLMRAGVARKKRALPCGAGRGGPRPEGGQAAGQATLQLPNSPEMKAETAASFARAGA